mgnify:CR=1 FL=1
MKTIYVTFSVPHLFQSDEKFAVKCENMDGAREVAQDAFALHGIKNVRIRKCGKARNCEIMSYDNYLEYDEWY